jgi:hypothetical protein
LCTEFPGTEFKDQLMCLNWLKLYDINTYLLVDGTMMKQCA